VHSPLTGGQEADLRALHDDLPTGEGHWTRMVRAAPQSQDSERDDEQVLCYDQESCGVGEPAARLTGVTPEFKDAEPERQGWLVPHKGQPERDFHEARSRNDAGGTAQVKELNTRSWGNAIASCSQLQ